MSEWSRQTPSSIDEGYRLQSYTDPETFEKMIMRCWVENGTRIVFSDLVRHLVNATPAVKELGPATIRYGREGQQSVPLLVASNGMYVANPSSRAISRVYLWDPESLRATGSAADIVIGEIWTTPWGESTPSPVVGVALPEFEGVPSDAGIRLRSSSPLVGTHALRALRSSGFYESLG